LLLSATASSAVDGIRTEYIQFKKGANSGVVEATITGYETIDYVLRASAGQYMNVSLATKHAATYFNILAPGEDDVAMFNGSISDNQYEGILPATGDYKLRVYMMRAAARRNEVARYRLEVIIGDGKETSSTTPSAESAVAQPQQEAVLKSALHKALVQFLATEKIPDDSSHRCYAGFADLNGDNSLDAIVIMTGMYWCGTGGCTMLVYEGRDRSFTLVSSTSLVRPPVTVSAATTNGWRDLVVTVSGGGMPGKIVALQFDGRKYPANPSMLDALSGGVPATGLKLFAEGTNPEALDELLVQ